MLVQTHKEKKGIMEKKEGHKARVTWPKSPSRSVNELGVPTQCPTHPTTVLLFIRPYKQVWLQMGSAYNKYILYPVGILLTTLLGLLPSSQREVHALDILMPLLLNIGTQVTNIFFLVFLGVCHCPGRCPFLQSSFAKPPSVSKSKTGKRKCNYFV